MLTTDPDAIQYVTESSEQSMNIVCKLLYLQVHANAARLLHQCKLAHARAIFRSHGTNPTPAPPTQDMEKRKKRHRDKTQGGLAGHSVQIGGSVSASSPR